MLEIEVQVQPAGGPEPARVPAVSMSYRCPVFGLFGDTDPHIPVEEVEWMLTFLGAAVRRPGAAGSLSPRNAMIKRTMEKLTIPSATQSHPSFALDAVLEGDCVQLLRGVSDESVHLILTDIPYGIGTDEWDVLHSNSNSAYLGASPAQEKAGAVFRKRGKPLNGWSEADRRIPLEYYEWCSTWAGDWCRVLKPGASVFVFAGRRLQHRCVAALEDAGLTFKDMLAWVRPRAPHRAQRVSVIFGRRGDTANAEAWQGWRVGNLRPRFEPILWFVKPYQIGTTIADNVINQGVGAFNEEEFVSYAGQPDNWLEIGFGAGEAGLHPTQKPVRLMEALIALASRPGQTVLDPFAGSGSTLVAAQNLGRRFIGFELDPGYAGVARRRLGGQQLSLTSLQGGSAALARRR